MTTLKLVIVHYVYLVLQNIQTTVFKAQICQCLMSSLEKYLNAAKVASLRVIDDFLMCHSIVTKSSSNPNFFVRTCQSWPDFFFKPQFIQLFWEFLWGKRLIRANFWRGGECSFLSNKYLLQWCINNFTLDMYWLAFCLLFDGLYQGLLGQYKNAENDPSTR